MTWLWLKKDRIISRGIYSLPFLCAFLLAWLLSCLCVPLFSLLLIALITPNGPNTSNVCRCFVRPKQPYERAHNVIIFNIEQDVWTMWEAKNDVKVLYRWKVIVLMTFMYARVVWLVGTSVCLSLFCVHKCMWCVITLITLITLIALLTLITSSLRCWEL